MDDAGTRRSLRTPSRYPRVVVRPPRYARALVAVVGGLAACGGLTVSAAPAGAEPTAAPSTAPSPRAPGRAVDDAPLKVRITTMTPTALPADGPIVITGTVTNRTDETWRSISLFALMGDSQEAMRSPQQLRAATATPFDEVVGDRETVAGRFGEVEELLPGRRATYTIRVPASALEVDRPGVYWFGVHALGSSDSAPSDLTADGRARTFLPYVPDRFADDPVPVALVVPLTRQVRFAADGSVDDVDEWTTALGPDGELTRLLDFVDTTSQPVSWLVDPALLDAVGQLAAGNPPRSLGPVPGETSTTGDPTEAPTPDEQPDPSPSMQAAAAWLDALAAALAGDEVLALPYGNIDVPATLAHDKELYELALAQQSRVLQSLDVDPTPVLAPPSGYLDTAGIQAADPSTPILATDQMFPGRRPPAVARVDGRRLVTTSSGAVQGSPGPGPGVTTVGLRQRLLAEAAVRVVKGSPEPLVVVLPVDWALDDPVGFFSDLAPAWLDRTTVDAAAASTLAETVSTADLDYPPRQHRRELDAPTVEAVGDLVKAGDTLQSLLVDNNDIGGVVAEEALTGLSYSVRDDQSAGRTATGASQDWVDDRLGAVSISASPGVTLSSASGEFAVTLSNDLDYPVTVRVEGDTDQGLEVTPSKDVALGPGSRTNLLLRARSTDNRVHNVRLVVTDTAGVPIGATDVVPIRSAQVSDVIWLIMGTGAGLLFLAIAVRLFRRIRAARRGDSEGATRTETLEPAEAP